VSAAAVTEDARSLDVWFGSPSRKAQRVVRPTRTQKSVRSAAPDTPRRKLPQRKTVASGSGIDSANRRPATGNRQRTKMPCAR
jgi:hypothetical protein